MAAAPDQNRESAFAQRPFLAEAFVVLFVTALLARALAFEALAGASKMTTLGVVQAALVGALGDAWVATLGALVIEIVVAPLRLARWPRAAMVVRIAWLAAWVAATAMHQAYVAFFRFPIVPFHLRYLVDLDFLAANGQDLLALRPIAIAAIGFGLLALMVVFPWPRVRGRQRRLAVTVASLAVVLVAHNRNIHYRVQWFVPENLQVNALEHLYLAWMREVPPKPLTTEEVASLAEALGAPLPAATTSEPQAMLGLITRRVGDVTAAPLGLALREGFAAELAAGTKPAIIVLLLESMRPSETGVFAPNQPSLTPHLDELASRGALLTRAFSTGTVTRGGQEATMCGFQGGRDTSLMRGQSVVGWRCLPEMMAQPVAGHRGVPFWLHGGEGRFDGQLDFWRARGAAYVLSVDDFAASAARNGWGIGDRTFLSEAATRLVKMRDDLATSDFLFGLVLTITNHVPWALPSDAPKLPEYAHPSYATTAYADLAVGEFVERLRASGVWDHAFVVIASDHGNKVPPYQPLYANEKHADAWLQTHIDLILSGGIAEKAMATLGHPGGHIPSWTSQADIAALTAYVAGRDDASLMGEMPFADGRHLPVVAQLEDGFFAPSEDRVFSVKDIGRLDASTLSPEERRDLLYLRAFLTYRRSAQERGAPPP